ncbi:hypothetical protein [Prochlorococcus sp. MIT 1300]|uniref:hypothetical protein n=1 Tax=Prochlorococcus sp. MIT 1300 TaxID=3096218 RepID=UPI002A75D12A|nr:hypothetical protein [Prochlorococcus sp. MIT 1300]
MSSSVQFSDFYRVLEGAKNGDNDQLKKLDWILAEYEHATNSINAYDELGQIFCHIGVMKLYEYTGIDEVKIISEFPKEVWDYLILRTKIDLISCMKEAMNKHAKEHDLPKKLCNSWGNSIEEIESNLEDLAFYVAEGIEQIVKEPA